MNLHIHSLCIMMLCQNRLDYFLQVLGQIASIEISELDQDVGNSLYQASCIASTVVVDPMHTQC